LSGSEQKVRQVIVETSRVKRLLLELTGWQGHLPGQHVDIRLTGEDGYQAQRSYSIASPPEDELIALRVERVENGEVSPYLVEELRSGDQFELRGPIGGYFVRTAAMSDPLCLIAAGSGIAPLMAMLRHRDRRNSRVPAVLLHSSRNLEDVIYRKELDAMARRDPDLRVVNTLSRKQPEGCQRDLLVPARHHLGFDHTEPRDLFPQFHDFVPEPHNLCLRHRIGRQSPIAPCSVRCSRRSVQDAASSWPR
jgi:ferredoxin-NADP reductase